MANRFVTEFYTRRVPAPKPRLAALGVALLGLACFFAILTVLT